MKGSSVRQGLIMALALAVTFALPRFAGAAGANTHMAMTREAVKKVSIPELRALLASHKRALICGVSFPDFGTAIDYGTFHKVKVGYGSAAHQPPFVEAYFKRVLSECGPDYDECGRLVAHFLGVAAHGMEDDLYDELFMNKAKVLDPEGSRVNHDLWADEIFVVKYDPFYLAPPYYLPVNDLVEVYRDLGMEVRRRDLRSGKFYHQVGAAALRGIAPYPYPHYAKVMSFSRDNIVTHPGGIDHTATVIARYWEILWKRLQGAPRSEEMILETWPHPAAIEHEWDHGSLYSRVTVYFATGMDKDSIDQSSFYLVGPDGKRLAATFRIEHEDDSFAVLIPGQDLEPGATYTAVITTGVKDMDGNPLPQEHRWSFSTSKEKP